MDARLLLNGMAKLGPVSVRKLLIANQNDPREIFSASRSALLAVDGIGPAMADSILDEKNENWLQKEKEEMLNRGIQFISDENYPELLNQIYDPPIGLYLKGCIPEQPCIGIVGTRQPSLYGKRICHELAKGLAEAGFCIVSGMARGIDSIAHQAALEVKGKTIAFLGCGLDIIYPPENLKLYREISEKGAVISEFPLSRKADRRTFPMRNRLVSGISSAILVIESAAAGGSLITAQFAGEHGRLHVISHSKREPENPSTGLATEKSQRSENLTPEEREVFSTLSDGTCLNLEQMMQRVSLDFPTLSSTLSMMEISGVLEKRADGKFELK